jgi:GR25 family glycosyltransferase involved in LPS biosynthesis
VVFLNQRFTEFANIPQTSAVADYLTFRATDTITPASCSKSSITGGEGYILTPPGARRLIEMYDITFMPVPVDWFIFFATRSDHFELEHFAPWQLERMAQATRKIGCLRGYYSVFSTIICDDMDYSPRRSNS